MEMIYTVTLNPAIDYVMEAESFDLGRTNRSAEERVYPGGKGINVSIVLKNLGLESTAIGVIAGFTGLEIERRLKKAGIETNFLRVGGMSRINVKIKHKTETEINGAGPVLDENDLENLYRKITFLKKEDWLVLSGNAPRGAGADVYAEFLRRAQGAKTVLDTSGELFLRAVGEKPFFVKPNVFELEEITRRKTGNNKSEVMKSARELRSMGARNVLVTMGGDGAVFSGEEGEYIFDAPKGDVVNTVGSGDSAVAGFICGMERGLSAKGAAAFAVAAGSAGAFSEELASLEETERLFEKVKN